MRKYYKAIKVNGKKKDEHRYIMEVHLGRKLTKGEVVHHKDGNKLNNDLSNLEVMSLREHSRMHVTGHVKSEGELNKLRLQGIKNRPAAKLSVEQVLLIKEKLRKGAKGSELARMFNVAKTTISAIKTGRSFYWL